MPAAADLDAIFRAIRLVEPPPRLPVALLGGEAGYEAISMGGVRAAHAIDTAAAPDAEDGFEHEGHRLVLATRYLEAGRCTILTIAFDREDARHVVGAFRLFGAEAEDVARDPVSAFRKLLIDCGASFTFDGGPPKVFVPAARTMTAPGPSAPIAADVPRATIVASVRGDSVTNEFLFAWVFVLDADRYRATLKAHRR